VRPRDIVGYTQSHFFAGIGGWSYALRLAGWDDRRPVWTGSCPCQPFSAAGKGKGFADERHLWPAWFHLCREYKPLRIFGEQVANALGWLDLVSTDLEAEGYSVGAAIMGAHSVGAPHIRQRLYWMADSKRDATQQGRIAVESRKGVTTTSARAPIELGRRCDTSGLGNADEPRPQRRRDAGSGRADQRSPWAASDFVECRDGKRRPVEPGIFPLAHGVPGRVGLLRGYGNAIVPQVAAAFIEACMT
jgi:DNA (cytosine-5)-methyltransferase 1